MSNPWKCSLEDVALGPLKHFLENSQQSGSISFAQRRLNNDSTDLITKLREADEQTKCLYQSFANEKQLKEDVIALELACKDLLPVVAKLRDHFHFFDNEDCFKISTANVSVFAANSATSYEISSYNLNKLSLYIKTIGLLIKELYSTHQERVIVLNDLIESLETSENVPVSQLQTILNECIKLVNSFSEAKLKRRNRVRDITNRKFLNNS